MINSFWGGASQKRVYLRSHRGNYLQDARGKVGMVVRLDAWEEFVMENAGHDQVFIRSHRGMYLQDNRGKPGMSENRDAWEKWTPIPNGKGQYFLRGHFGTHLSDQQVYLVGMSSNRLEWEEWTIGIIEDSDEQLEPPKKRLKTEKVEAVHVDIINKKGFICGKVKQVIYASGVDDGPDWGRLARFGTQLAKSQGVSGVAQPGNWNAHGIGPHVSLSNIHKKDVGKKNVTFRVKHFEVGKHHKSWARLILEDRDTNGKLWKQKDDKQHCSIGRKYH